MGHNYSRPLFTPCRCDSDLYQRCSHIFPATIFLAAPETTFSWFGAAVVVVMFTVSSGTSLSTTECSKVIFISHGRSPWARRSRVSKYHLMHFIFSVRLMPVGSSTALSRHWLHTLFLQCSVRYNNISYVYISSCFFCCLRFQTGPLDGSTKNWAFREPAYCSLLRNCNFLFFYVSINKPQEGAVRDQYLTGLGCAPYFRPAGSEIMHVWFPLLNSPSHAI